MPAVKEDVSSCIIKLEPHYFAIGEVSDVYRCNFTQKDRSVKMVAVKVMRGLTSGEDARKRFRKDIFELVKTWMQLSYPNIMQCYGICYHLGHLPGLVLPLCSGNVLTYLQQFPNTQKLDLLLQVSSAIHYLHSIPLVHTDIRGASILMHEHTPLLMDTALTPLIKYNDFTVAGMYGRPRWMAPEILDPPNDVPAGNTDEITYTLETDIYAFGMTMLEVLTGKPPYSHRRYDTLVLLDVIRGVRPTRPSEAKIADDVWRLITICWDRIPEKRPSAAVVESWLNSARLSQPHGLSPNDAQA